MSDETLFYIAISLWVFLSFIVSGIANAKGRHPVSYFLMALLLSPLVAIVALYVVDRRKDPTSTDQ